MSLPNLIFTIVASAAFIVMFAMGIMGLRSTLEPHEDSTWTPPLGPQEEEPRVDRAEAPVLIPHNDAAWLAGSLAARIRATAR